MTVSTGARSFRRRMETNTRWEGDCLVWTGARQRQNYGVSNSGYGFRHSALGRRSNGKYGTVPAHRWVWTYLRGPIPDGQVIMHTCDNPPCVNPAHLRVGTQAENIADRDAKGRGRVRGDTNGNSKLSEADARSIKASSEPLQVIAGRYGVARSTIVRIRSGKTWGHL